MTEQRRFTGDIESPPGVAVVFRQHARRLMLRAAGLRYRLRRGLSRRSSNQVKPRAVLLIRPDHLGDMLLLTPGLRALRTALPQARIALLAGPWSSEIIRGCPDLDEVITCDFPGFERRPKSGLLGPYRYLFAQAKGLSTRDFDTAVVLRFDHWWGAWLAAAAGIPRRIGYHLPETEPFLTDPLPYRPERHETEQNAILLANLTSLSEFELGPMRFGVSAADTAWAKIWLAGQGVDAGQRLIVIHPGAGAAVKQWPAVCWAEVADALAARYGARILLTGGPGEQDLTRGIAAAMTGPTIDAAGHTTLGQLAALQARADLVLGSDSGPMKLAVAMDVPTIHLYGPVSADKFGPWGDPGRHRVLKANWSCAPCNRLDWPVHTLLEHGCMRSIRPEHVLAAGEELLGGSV